jgi:hypothetical protein
MSKLDDIRAAIVAKLQAVTGIGNVHDYERFAVKESEFKTLYQSGDHILGWHVRRVSRVQKAEARGCPVITTTWKIRGFKSLADADATEKEFDTLIDNICVAFDDDPTLGGVVSDAIPESGEVGIQLEDSGPVMFAGVLSHGASLRFTTQHYQETT